VDLLYVALGRAGLPVTHYHGRMRAADRQLQQERFMRGKRAHVMVATSAFGMGIDKPDIRFVLHYQAPGSLEQYVQEAGRAGRDGRPADCVLLFSEEDLEVQARLLSRSRPSPRQLLRLAGALRAWAAEGKAVAAAELALSAEVPATTAGALLASLEAVGAVGEEEGRFAARLPPEQLEERAQQLARRLETQRTQDRRRLEAVREYAQGEECRSLLLRRYFGEAEAPPCGQCDVCRAKGLGPAPGRKRRRRGRRRPGTQRAGGREAGGPAPRLTPA
jgi:ATP-dependent DNA helicase RecQ